MEYFANVTNEDIVNMDYKNLLENSYNEYNMNGNPPHDRFEYLSKTFFNFITYDRSIDKLFVRKAIDFCMCISHGQTFELIKNNNEYEWYLIMFNMPFFLDKIQFGSTITGAWWKDEVYLKNFFLYLGKKQILLNEIEFTREQWKKFIQAICEFSEQNNQQKCNRRK